MKDNQRQTNLRKDMIVSAFRNSLAREVFHLILVNTFTKESLMELISQKVYLDLPTIVAWMEWIKEESKTEDES